MRLRRSVRCWGGEEAKETTSLLPLVVNIQDFYLCDLFYLHL